MKQDPLNSPFYKQTKVDQTINRIINNDTKITQAVLHQVYIVAQVEAGIAKFRGEAEDMTAKERAQEEHCSKRLSEHMTKMGDPKPHEKCDAHAIVAGGHPKAHTTRLVMAKFKRRKDDPSNGCWLPRNTAAKLEMPARLREAMPHSRVHRHKYFEWIAEEININAVKSVKDLDLKLNHIAFRLQSGTFPNWVMLKAHEKRPTEK